MAAIESSAKTSSGTEQKPAQEASWSTPFIVAAAAIGIVASPAAGAAIAVTTLAGTGANSLQKDAQAPAPAPAKEPEIPVSTDPLGNMYEDSLGYGGVDTSVYREYTDPFDSACVEVRSRLPGKVIAGEVCVGDALQLADAQSLESGAGVVSYSERKPADGYRITAEGGVSLVCSDTAPIPTPDGLVLAPALTGKKVAVRIDEGGSSRVEWRPVTGVEAIGKIEVQHITVGDKCFWAGEKAGAYILHHNLKMVETGPLTCFEEWWWW